jgi:chitin synthase
MYLLCIPSMYLLLTIYSITNLNVVSWGTREVAVKKSKKEMEEEKKQVHLIHNKVDRFNKVLIDSVKCSCFEELFK